MKSITQFIHEVKVEMTKVVWPSFRELVGSTIIVLIVVVAFAMYLGFLDYVFSKFAEVLYTRYGMR